MGPPQVKVGDGPIVDGGVPSAFEQQWNDFVHDGDFFYDGVP